MESERRSNGWSRRDSWACLACMLLALFFAVLPHLSWLAARGSLDYLADGDDVYYLTLARIPYHGESHLRDPFTPPSRNLPSLYGDLPFVPLSKMARAIGLPPQRIAILWRVVGGLGMGMALYVLFRSIFRSIRYPAAFSMGCVAIFLSDNGVITGRNLIQTSLYLIDSARGVPHLHIQNGLNLYRVVTPLLTLPPLLLLAACLVGTNERLSWRRILIGTGCLGLCVYLYFYFWTAAVVALGGLAATATLAALATRDDPERRRRRFVAAQTATLIVVGGITLGAPQILSNSRTFSDPEIRPILERSQRGRALAPDEPKRFWYLKRPWNWAHVILGAGAFHGLGMRILTPIWWLVVAGFALTNSAIVTGLEFENFHWFYVANPSAEVLLLSGLVLAMDRWWPHGRRGMAALAILPLISIVLGMVWRVQHVLEAPQTLSHTHTLIELSPLADDLAALGPEDILAGPPLARVALLLSRSGMLYQSNQSAISSLIPMSELNERHALNAWLLGLDQREYGQQAGYPSFEAGEGRTKPELTAPVLARQRLEIFREIEQDPAPFLERYQPNALLWPTSQAPPQRGGPWRLVRRAPAWELWERAAPDDPPAPEPDPEPTDRGLQTPQ